MIAAQLIAARNAAMESHFAMSTDALSNATAILVT
jgi:hypothetical protein